MLLKDTHITNVYVPFQKERYCVSTAKNKLILHTALPYLATIYFFFCNFSYNHFLSKYKTRLHFISFGRFAKKKHKITSEVDLSSQLKTSQSVHLNSNLSFVLFF